MQRRHKLAATSAAFAAATTAYAYQRTRTWIADQITLPGGPRSLTPTAVVTAIDHDVITLQTDDLDVDLQVVDVVTPGSRLRLGPSVPGATDAQSRRTYTMLDGQPPSPGTPAALDPYLEGLDSQRSDLARVAIPVDRGNAPALLLGKSTGHGQRWIIGVHGHGGSPSELLRLASTLDRGQMPLLSVSYGGDGIAPAFAHGRATLGLDEAGDVVDAARWIRSVDRDATFVLAGISMGAAIALRASAHPVIAGRLDGLILDSPLISVEDVTATAVADKLSRRAPSQLVRVLARHAADKAAQDLQYSADLWDLSDVRPNAPTLVLAGTADLRVPVKPVTRWVDAHDNVEAHFVDGGRHARVFNADPGGYAKAVHTFLDRLPA